MIINLDNKYRIISDGQSFDIQSKTVAAKDGKTKKKGDESWTSFKYLGNLELALKRYAEISLGNIEGNKTASEIIEAIEKLNKNIDIALTQLKPF